MVSTLENPRAFSAPRTVGIRHCTVMNFAVIWHKDRLGLVGYRLRPFLTLVSAIDHWIWWRLEYLDDPLVAQSNIQMELFYWGMICYIYINIYNYLYIIYIYIMHIDTHIYIYIDTHTYIYIYTYGTIWNYCLIPSDPRLRGPKALLGRLAFDLRALLRPWRRSGWCHARALNCGHHLGNKPWWHNIDMTWIDFEIQGYPSETAKAMCCRLVMPQLLWSTVGPLVGRWQLPMAPKQSETEEDPKTGKGPKSKWLKGVEAGVPEHWNQTDQYTYMYICIYVHIL